MLLLLFNGGPAGPAPPVVLVADNRDVTGTPNRNVSLSGTPNRNVSASGKASGQAVTGRPPD